MSKCPYTFFRNIFAPRKAGVPHDGVAKHLRVSVAKGGETVVDVALPAQSARWLIDLIPDDVLAKIREEGIPISEIQDEISQSKELSPRSIFTLAEPHRKVDVWLE